MAIAAPIPYPLVNGRRYSFSSIGFLAGSSEIIGVTEVNYGQEARSEPVYGTSRQKIGSTNGILKPKFSLTMLQWEYENFVDDLCDLNGTPGSGYMDVRQDYVIQFQDGPPTNLGPLFVHIIRGANIVSEDDSYKVGPEANAVKVEFDIFYIERNGDVPITVTGTSSGFIPA